MVLDWAYESAHIVKAWWYAWITNESNSPSPWLNCPFCFGGVGWFDYFSGLGFLKARCISGSKYIWNKRAKKGRIGEYQIGAKDVRCMFINTVVSVWTMLVSVGIIGLRDWWKVDRSKWEIFWKGGWLTFSVCLQGVSLHSQSYHTVMIRQLPSNPEV